MKTLSALRQHLRENGYTRLMTTDEPTSVSVLDLVIKKTGASWQVYETERGETLQTFADSHEEEEAVETFLRIASIRIYHLKTCETIEDIRDIEDALRIAQVPFQRNDVPFEGWLRVFVTGAALLQAQRAVAHLTR